MGLNPLAKMKELKAALPNIKEMQKLAQNQRRQADISIQEVIKQTRSLEEWAIAAEAQVEQLDRIATALEKIAKKK